MHQENTKNPPLKRHATPLKLHNYSQNHEWDRKTCIWISQASKHLTNKVGLHKAYPTNQLKHAINLINGVGIHWKTYFKFSWRRVSPEQVRRRIKNDSDLRRVPSVNIHTQLHLIFNSYFLLFLTFLFVICYLFITCPIFMFIF